ncbi:MAG TPA: SRPBCC family protein [Saprospiraceae bacterium]|nr:SRPBCC family protein [Saprospiraceae bacterium]
MRINTITIKHSIIITKPREIVWDYTQNYDNRPIWDYSIVKAEVLQDSPNRIIRLKAKGNTIMTFHYKHDDRPHKTSLVAKEVISPIIESAGGSWTYDKIGRGTLWKQTNTIVFKNNLMSRLMLPFYKWVFTRQIRGAMRCAKLKIERDN